MAASKSSSNNTDAIPTTMRAFQMVKYDVDPDVAVAENDGVAVEPPKKGELLVRVEAIGITGSCARFAEGHARIMYDKLPMTMGQDCAGVVAAVGPDTKTDLKVGDRVFGTQDDFNLGRGTACDFTAIRADSVVRIPDGLSFATAAALPTSVAVAWRAIVTSKLVQPESQGSEANAKLRILILGGSCATGMMMVQLCSHFGVGHIAATSSQVDLLKSLGAHRVVNHRAGEDWKELLKGENFDAIVNCIEGVEAFRAAPAVLRRGRGARYLTIQIDHPDTPLTGWGAAKLVGGLLWRKPWSLLGYPSYELVTVGHETRGLPEVAALVKDGKLRVVYHDEEHPASPWTLESFRQLLRIQNSWRAHGRLVMSRDA